MRLLILILLTVFFKNTFGQKILNGEFCTIPNFSGLCIDFHTDTFQYVAFTDLSEAKGKGTYHILENKIYLSFDNIERINKKSINYFPSTSNDSIEVNIKVLDIQTEKPIENLTLIVSKIQYFDNSDIIIGAETDSSGMASIKLKNDTIKLWLSSVYINLPRHSFEIKTNNSSSINIYRTFNNTSEITNTEIVLETEIIEEKKIIILNSDGSKTILVHDNE